MPRLRPDIAGMWIIRPTAPNAPHRWEHLQLLRAPGRYMSGTWSICRGGIEPGETAIAAAVREMREETGLTPTEFYRLSTLEQFYNHTDDTIWMCPFFAALVPQDAQVILNNEHTDFRWVPDPDIAPALVWPGEHNLLAEIRTFVLNDHPTKRLTRMALKTDAT